jgi:ABC-2 type transport system permease protein
VVDRLGVVGRLLRLWALFARMDLALLLRNRQQFVLWFVSDFLSRAGAVVGVFLLAERFGGIAHWSEAEVGFLLSYGFTVTGLQQLFFSYNMAAVSRRVARGHLDHSLVQPQSLLMTFVTEGFAPFQAVSLVVPGLGMMALTLAVNDVAMTATTVGLLVVSLLASTVVLIAFSFVWGAAAFWAPRGAEEISAAAAGLVTELKSFPLEVVGKSFRVLLLSVVPTGYLAWLPASSTLGRQGAEGVFSTVLAAVVLVLIAAIAFRRGLVHYARTGSQRYSQFGHRR